MSIKHIFVFIILFFPAALLAQFSDYTLSDLDATAKYGTGERQSNAQNELAIRYKNGTGGASKDQKKAVYWFTESANNGNKYAQNNLAYCYLDGQGMSPDTSKAIYWFEKSANQYLPSAALRLGKIYYFGEGVPANYSKAAKYFKTAAFCEEVEGMYYYSCCYAFGYGVHRDSTKAVLWAKRAIDNDYPNAYWILGKMFQNGETVTVNKIKAEYYYKKGSDNNVSACQNALGVGYEKGDFWYKDLDKAVEYYTKAANNHNTYAMKNLSRLYYFYDYGMQDFKQAAYWYQKLYDTGNGDQYIDLLINLYEYLKDYNSAYNLYQKMASSGDVNALNQLAYYYAEGKVVTKNFDQALTLIDKAISLAPDDVTYLDSKGEILLKKGDINGATKIWKKICKSFPHYYQEYLINNGVDTPLNEYMKANAK